MSGKRVREQEILGYLVDNESDGDDFSASESSYEPSDEDEVSIEEADELINSRIIHESSAESEIDDIVDQAIGDEGSVLENLAEDGGQITGNNYCAWANYTENENFEPKFKMPLKKEAEVLLDLPRGASEFNIFRKIFPKSLCIRIAECTNQRIKKMNRDKSMKRALTDEYEILVVLGVSLIMHYNHLPSIADYWSKQSSLGNEMIKKSISRDRFTLLMSKMYFNDCDKPNDAQKDYYISEVVSCIKKTFPAGRSESSAQSIDECMAKFKGRSSLKQYMPLKPIKRGIKLWLRCDAETGYTYDLNVYTGKETSPSSIGTLGERIVRNLTSSIREENVVLAFDRFFTSMTLLKTLSYPAIGTYIRTRKGTSAFNGVLKRSQSQFQIQTDGIMAARWMDSKEVLLASNCHMPTITKVQRKQKDGSKLEVDCPLAIADYNRIMGGVDLADQKAAIYDINRKSQKWWKKVFFKILMLAVVNSWILFAQCQRRKTPLIQFIVPLAETLIAEGTKHKKLTTRQFGGRPAKKSRTERLNIGDHLPIEQSSRRRTKYVCSGCNNALCYKCFAPFHK